VKFLDADIFIRAFSAAIGAIGPRYPEGIGNRYPLPAPNTIDMGNGSGALTMPRHAMGTLAEDVLFVAAENDRFPTEAAPIPDTPDVLQVVIAVLLKLRTSEAGRNRGDRRLDTVSCRPYHCWPPRCVISSPQDLA
jgi:hypothetical protein